MVNKAIIVVCVIIIIVFAIWYFGSWGKKDDVQSLKNNDNDNDNEIYQKAPDKCRIMIWQDEWTPDIVKSNKDKLFIFEDNEDQVGLSGTSVIRPETNSYGIPTKLRPYSNEESQYTDDEYSSNVDTIIDALETIKSLSIDYDWIVFPKNMGIELSQSAPKTYMKMLSEIYNLCNAIDPEGSDDRWGSWIKYMSEYPTNRQRLSAVF